MNTTLKFPLVGWLTLIVLAVWPVASLATAANANADQLFANANQLYESGDFAEAESQYRAIVDSNHWSPELFFNLGNTLHKQGKPGEAALWYHRCLTLDPGMPEARQNLRVIEEQTGALTVELKGYERWIAADWLNPSLFPLAAAFCLWTAVLLVVIVICIKRSRPYLPALLLTSVFCLILATTAWWAQNVWHNKLDSSSYAVVTSMDAVALVSAVPDAAAVIQLPAGSRVRIRERRGSWLYIAITGQSELRGWLHTDQGESVWPLVEPKGKALAN
jgi:tetratricopeptide (TPR) repeat protein